MQDKNAKNMQMSWEGVLADAEAAFRRTRTHGNALKRSIAENQEEDRCERAISFDRNESCINAELAHYPTSTPRNTFMSTMKMGAQVSAVVRKIAWV